MPADISPVATRWMIAGEWRAHPARVVLAALAIAIGVALGLAVHLINASALSEFDAAIRTVNGDADLQAHATGPQGFDEGLYPILARLPGVAQASPVVELPATTGRGGRLTLLAIDVLRAASVTPRLLGAPAAGRSPLDESSMFLSDAALAASGRKLGDAVRLTAAGRTADFVIAGRLPGVDDGQAIAVVDIAVAQWRFGQLGRLQRIDLKLAPGADRMATQAAIARALPAAAELVSARSQARRSDSLSRAYRVNLDMLALVALLTGAFLVYSAQALSVARRRAQFALLRVLGVSRRALLAQIVVEAAVVGGVGALAGLALGVGLAGAALRLLGGDLGGGYFTGAAPSLAFDPAAAAVFGLLGLLAALAGSIAPAREAARAPPAVVLKNLGDAVDPAARPKARVALLLLAAGGALAFAPAVGGLPLFGYLSIALMLGGGIAAMPWLARVLLSPLQRAPLTAPSLDLAIKRLWGAPSQAAIALCGIVASTSLMIAMAVMVSSFRGSVDDWLSQVLAADIYATVDPAGGGLDPAAQRTLAGVAGVQSVTFLKETTLRLSPDRPPVALVARTINPASPATALPLLGAARPVPAGAVAVWVSEPAAWLYGYRAGQTISLPIAGPRPAPPVVVAGVWRDYARQHGSIAIDSTDYTRLTGDAQRTGVSVTLEPDADPDATIKALRAALPAGVSERTMISQPREIRAQALRVFDRSFAVTYLLEAIAILVGLAGVAATVSAQTLARTKEFGMLRHVGVRRRQIMAMLAAEGALLGAVGVIAGIGLGAAMSQVLIHVVNPQSFHWTMETRLPWGLFASVAAALIAAAAGTALLAGRRALSADAVRAVREDW